MSIKKREGNKTRMAFIQQKVKVLAHLFIKLIDARVLLWPFKTKNKTQRKWEWRKTADAR